MSVPNRRPLRIIAVAQEGRANEPQPADFFTRVYLVNNPTAVETEVAQRVVQWIDAGHSDIAGLSTAARATLRCPSASNSHGDEVFAVFDNSTNELRFLPELIDIPDVVGSVVDLDEFSLRNRLAGWCLTSGCDYWQGACRLGHFVNQVTVSVRPASSECAIADTCRWRREHGAQVCAPCAGIRNLPINLRRPKSEGVPAEGFDNLQGPRDDERRGCQ